MAEFFEMSDEDKQIPAKALGYPLLFPPTFIQWVKGQLEINPPQIMPQDLVINNNGTSYIPTTPTGYKPVTVPTSAVANPGDVPKYDPTLNGGAGGYAPGPVAGGGTQYASFGLTWEGNVSTFFRADATYTITAVTGISGTGAGTVTFSWKHSGGAPIAGLPTVGQILAPGETMEIIAANNAGKVSYLTITASVV